MEAVKGRIIFKQSDMPNDLDCHLDMGFEIPFELMNDVMCLIIEWKSKVQIVPDEYDAYKENLKKIDFPVIKPKKNKL